jgi:hypothetical protein
MHVRCILNLPQRAAADEPLQPAARVVTLELVNQLRDEAPWP